MTMISKIAKFSHLLKCSKFLTLQSGLSIPSEKVKTALPPMGHGTSAFSALFYISLFMH